MLNGHEPIFINSQECCFGELSAISDKCYINFFTISKALSVKSLKININRPQQQSFTCFTRCIFSHNPLGKQNISTLAPLKLSGKALLLAGNCKSGTKRCPFNYFTI